MKLLERFFKSKKEEKGLAEVIYGWRWGEPKPLDQKQLLELVEGTPDLRAAIEALVNASIVNGWIIVGEDEEKEKVERWIAEREDEFIMFLRNLVMSSLIFGEAYVEVFADPVFKVLDTYTVEAVRDEYGKVDGYIQRINGREVVFSSEEIVHLVMHPLGTRAYGSPIISSLRRVLEGQMYAELLIRDAFMRKGVLSKVFIMKSGTDADFERIVKAAEQSRPGSSFILKGDISIQDLGHPFKELQVLDILNEYRQKIVTVTGVPEIILGITKAATLETSRNQINAFTMKVKSIQQIVSAAVTSALRRRIKTRARFRLLEWTNPEQETRIHVMRVQSGIETINEARKALGLNEIDHPLANTPIPFIQLVSRNNPSIFSIEEVVERLLEESRQMIPEKSLSKEID
ncbi:MAG: phage portal protein [Aigarchaeota archaeon]|nr:phage portal protein [Aigarchaeota archaeon]MCX8192403.1 phage portal protein [Nitrososphaeria archaeon]MDW7986609.1 phage portal protein [Nitrososphaerota archaeon]